MGDGRRGQDAESAGLHSHTRSAARLTHPPGISGGPAVPACGSGPAAAHDRRPRSPTWRRKGWVVIP